MLNVIEDPYEHFLLTQTKGGIFASILVGTVMDDTVHVQLLYVSVGFRG